MVVNYCSMSFYEEELKMDDKSSLGNAVNREISADQINLGEEEWLRIIQSLPQSSISSLLATCKRIEQTKSLPFSPNKSPDHETTFHSQINSKLELDNIKEATSGHQYFLSDMDSKLIRTSENNSENRKSSTAGVRALNLPSEEKSEINITINVQDSDTKPGAIALRTASIDYLNHNTPIPLGKPKFKALNFTPFFPPASASDTRPSPTIGQTPKRLAAAAATLAEDSASPECAPPPVKVSIQSNEDSGRICKISPMLANEKSGVVHSGVFETSNPPTNLSGPVLMREDSEQLCSASSVSQDGDRGASDFQQVSFGNRSRLFQRSCLRHLESSADEASNKYRNDICCEFKESVDDEDVARHEKRRERNRLAAAKCRQNRQNQIELLRKSVNALRDARHDLQARLGGVLAEKTQIEEAIQKHALSGCSAAELLLQNRRANFPSNIKRPLSLSIGTDTFVSRSLDAALLTCPISICRSSNVSSVSETGSLSCKTFSTTRSRFPSSVVDVDQDQRSTVPVGINLLIITSPSSTVANQSSQNAISIPSLDLPLILQRFNSPAHLLSEDAKSPNLDSSVSDNNPTNQKGLPDLLTSVLFQEATKRYTLNLFDDKANSAKIKPECDYEKDSKDTTSSL